MNNNLFSIKSIDKAIEELKGVEYTLRKKIRDKYAPDFKDYKKLHIVFNPKYKDEIPDPYEWMHFDENVEDVVIFSEDVFTEFLKENYKVSIDEQ